MILKVLTTRHLLECNALTELRDFFFFFRFIPLFCTVSNIYGILFLVSLKFIVHGLVMPPVDCLGIDRIGVGDI